MVTCALSSALADLSLRPRSKELKENADSQSHETNVEAQVRGKLNTTEDIMCTMCGSDS